MLGISYVVMQTAVENNYLPRTETTSILEYINSTGDISMVQDIGLVIGVDDGKVDHAPTYNTTSPQSVEQDGYNYFYIRDIDQASGGALQRHQYGNSIVCGVYCEYKIIWPLDYRYTGDRDAIVNGTGQYTYNDVVGYDGTAGAPKESYLSAWAKLPILITYEVPGLKYYPDLEIY